jgi:hypothetical protein
VPDVATVIDATDPALLLTPQSPFVALHAAVVLGAAEDADGLSALTRWSAGHADPVHAEVVAPLARALRRLVQGDPSGAADALARVQPALWRVGGSDAQREVVEETRICALVRAGRYAEALVLVDARLDRRRCRRDEWFQAQAQLTEIWSPSTVAVRGASGDVAGPDTGDPSVMENRLP